jgi:hypothetical protein
VAAAAGLRIGTKTRSDLHSVARTDKNFKRYFVTTPAETAPSRRAKNSDHRNVRFHANFLSSLGPSSERIGNAVRPGKAGQRELEVAMPS